MNIDITSFFFNSSIEGATATSAWGTSIGQSKSKECRIESETFGVTEVLTGMLFKSKTNRECFDLSKGSSSREYLIYSVFDKVYVNGILVDGMSFIVLLARENSKSHPGRLIVSYPPYATYKDESKEVSNQSTINAMAKVLGCKSEGCWFAYELSIVNQDELHFSAVVVNSEKSMVYKGTSSERSAEWANLIPDEGVKHSFLKEIHKGSQQLQVIYYGAPGTGKSNEIKLLTGKGYDDFQFSKNFTFRTTFHPDSDYSSFIGAYKPIWNGEKIIYEFRPQTFLKAYIAAWTNPNENVALVIEEINRGNCAQIFGDIFQLLDRESNGLSKYPIETDADMQTFLHKAFSGEIEGITAIDEANKVFIDEYYSDHYDNAFNKIKEGVILTLPRNLSILATMNTSDQSLFPMDSAFKRRWNWTYMPIKNPGLNWKIKLNESYDLIDWWDFLNRINSVISDLTTSEDKQLGYFFCQPDEYIKDSESRPINAKPDVITAKVFVDKVIFYLWNDVFKDYAFDAKCCKGSDEKEVLFAKFYNEDGSVNIGILKQFFDTLKTDEQEPLIKANLSIQSTSSLISEDTIQEMDNETEAPVISTE